jgi:hypothetical protein
LGSVQQHAAFEVYYKSFLNSLSLPKMIFKVLGATYLFLVVFLPSCFDPEPPLVNSATVPKIRKTGWV